MQQHAKHVHIARWMLSKTAVYILKPYQEIGLSLEESHVHAKVMTQLGFTGKT